MKSATNSADTEKSGKPCLELTEARPKATKINTKRQKTRKWKANHPNSTKSSKNWQKLTHPRKTKSKHDWKSTKGEQNSTTYQEIRLQVDIKGQKKTKRWPKTIFMPPQSYFGPKFQKNLIFRFSVILVKYFETKW